MCSSDLEIKVETKKTPIAGELTEEQKQEETFSIDCKDMIFLVVEDNNINQLVAQNMLEQFGALVEFADDGQKGVEIFLSDPLRFTAIFMDIQMPHMDGYEATSMIRGSNIPQAASIPIIAMTANAFTEDVEKAFSVGMNAHIKKPLDAEQIAKVIKEVLIEP